MRKNNQNLVRNGAVLVFMVMFLASILGSVFAKNPTTNSTLEQRAALQSPHSNGISISSYVEDFNNWANGQAISGEASGEHVHWVTASNYGGSTFQGSSTVISSGNSGRLYDASASDWVYACPEYDTPSPQTPSTSNQYWLAFDLYMTSGYLNTFTLYQGLGYPASSNVWYQCNANGSFVVDTAGKVLGTGLMWSLNTKYTVVIQCLSASTSRISIDGGTTWTQAYSNNQNWTGPIKEMCLYTGSITMTTTYVNKWATSWTQPTVPTAPQSVSAAAGNGQVVLNWAAPASNGGSPITGYTIYQGTTSGSEALLATIGNVLTYTGTGLTNGQTYYFKVAALNIMGTGTNSTEVNATLLNLLSSAFTMSSNPIQVGATLRTTHVGSNGAGSCTYQWNFGDASNATNCTTENGAHVYSTPGAYTVTLWMQDINGSTSKQSSAVLVSYIVEDFNNWANGQAISGRASGEHVQWVTGTNTGSCTFQGSSTVISSGNSGRIFDASGSDWIYACPEFDTPSPQTPSATNQYWISFDLYMTSGFLNTFTLYQGLGYPTLSNVWFQCNANGSFTVDTAGKALGTGLTWSLNTKYTVVIQCLSASTSRISIDGGNTWSQAYLNLVNWTGPISEMCFYTGSTPMTTSYLDNIGASWAQLPTAPQSVSAAAGNGQVVLNWAAPASNGGSPIAGYTIYQGTTSGNEAFLATIGNVLTYTATGLTNGQTYYFKVAAMNAEGIGLNSTEASATPAMTPTAPLLLTATPHNAQVFLCWVAPVSNGGSPITGYTIYQGTTSGSEALLATIGNVLSYTATGLTNGQTYYFKVAAVNIMGTGTNSTEVNAAPLNLLSAAFTMSSNPIQVGATLRTTHVGSNGAGSCTYQWNFGDASNATNCTTENGAHVYSTPGAYTVTLWMQDIIGSTSKQSSAVLVSYIVEDFNNWANGQAISGRASGEHVQWVTGTNTGSCTFQGSSTVISSGNSGRIFDASGSDLIYACPEFDTPSPQTPSATNQYWISFDLYMTSGFLNTLTLYQGLGYPTLSNVWFQCNANGSFTVDTAGKALGTGLTWSLNTKYTVVIQCLSASTSRISIDGGNTWSQAYLNLVNWTGPISEMCFYTGSTPMTTSYLDNIGASWVQLPTAPQSVTATPHNAQVFLSWVAPASNGGSPIIGYKIYLGLTSNSEVYLTTLGIVLSYTTTGLTNGQIYYCKVSALNANGEGGSSWEASATPLSNLLVVSAPLNNAIFTSNPVSLNFTILSPFIDKMWYVLDGGSSVFLVSNTSLSLSDGPHVIVFYANDTYGNNYSIVVSFKVEILSPNQNYNNYVIIIIVIGASVGVSAIVSYQVRVKRTKVGAARTKKSATSYSPSPGATIDSATTAAFNKRARMMQASPVVPDVILKKAKSSASSEPEVDINARGASARDMESQVNVMPVMVKCVVHKGPITGLSYTCTECGAIYCIQCAMHLADSGEGCWSCHAPVHSDTFLRDIQGPSGNPIPGMKLAVLSTDVWEKIRQLEQQGAIEKDILDEVLDELIKLHPAERLPYLERMFSTDLNDDGA